MTVADLNTGKIIDLIVDAAKARDFSAVHHHISELKSHMQDQGAPVDSETAFRLVESLSETSIFQSMPQQDLNNPYTLIDKIAAAADESAAPEIRAGLHDDWEKLHDLLANPGIRIENHSSEKLMSALKSTREHFGLLGQSAERFITRGEDGAHMHVHYAQALIDTGQPMAAIHTLNSLRPFDHIAENERDEIHGLLGRAHKQIYINHADPKRDASSVQATYQHHLGKAIGYYGEIYNVNYPGEKFYQGINYIALLALANRHGVPHNTGHDPKDLGEKLLGAISSKLVGTTDIWNALTIGEAYIAVGNYDKAQEYYHLAADHKEVKSFHIGSASRQIREIWQSENPNPEVRDIGLFLKEKLASMEVASFTLTAEDQKAVLGGMQLERHIDGGSQHQLRRVYNIALRAVSVARIHTSMKEPKGTGFLVEGNTINPIYGDELLLMTNAHVVWDPNLGKKMNQFQSGSLIPSNTLIQFELPTSDQEPGFFKCAEVVWQSPSGKHDVCLMRLDAQPINRGPLPISQARPAAETARGKKDGTRVTVIGHPNGGNLSMASMGNISNLKGYIVDIGGRYVNETHPEYMHYRVPTEGGNSGSPVFETQGWNLIGIHHAGFKEGGSLRRLNGADGVNIANEGVLISSIKHAIATDMANHGFLGLRKSETQKRALNGHAPDTKLNGQTPVQNG